MAAEVTGLLRGNAVVESYRYPPGRRVVLPSHTHEEYQLNLNLDLPGGYRYRGAYHVVPARVLTVVMPDEAHRPADPGDREVESGHLTLLISPGMVQAVAHTLSGGRPGMPTFRDLILDDPTLVHNFARVHARLTDPVSLLDEEVGLVSLVADLVRRCPDVRIADHQPAHRAVRRAREYLHENQGANVSLAELSSVSRLSPYRLTRLFTASVGVPPHSYQIQLRIEHAKRLLLGGVPASKAGNDAGFFDLSHFTRHFKRYVGVPPGVYARLAHRPGRAIPP
ncbi:MAG: helix-turn-helix transcriptional regulator [Pseudonocardia sp.]|nr:helix-turn-helix transcriptional regulator [Pseudonocardia sp.]MBO0872859.1 helix-turn-helix transcriptional regulator [Pseudonocardia sp.]